MDEDIRVLLYPPHLFGRRGAVKDERWGIEGALHLFGKRITCIDVKFCARPVGVYRVDPAVMDKATRVVWSWLTEYVTSQQTNVYASRYDDVQLIDRYDAERDL